MSEKFFFTQDIFELVKDIPADSIVSRTFYQEESLKVILFGFAPGQELSEHTASRPAILHFLKGEASLTMGEESFSVQSGSWSYMEPQLPHSIIAKTEVVMLLYML
ncbi:cupin domain-containing protein [bacterium]|nr:cupin domain-containing protein [bacterium]